MAATSENVSPTTYDLIGTWIGQQRQAPAPLTDKLRSALLGLEYALKVESVSLSEPEMGDFNWVGHLQGKCPATLRPCVCSPHLLTFITIAPLSSRSLLPSR